MRWMWSLKFQQFILTQAGSNFGRNTQVEFWIEDTVPRAGLINFALKKKMAPWICSLLEWISGSHRRVSNTANADIIIGGALVGNGEDTITDTDEGAHGGRRLNWMSQTFHMIEELENQLKTELVDCRDVRYTWTRSIVGHYALKNERIEDCVSRTRGREWVSVHTYKVIGRTFARNREVTVTGTGESSRN